MTALYIILGIIALIVILCSVKVKITAEYGEAFSLDVKWLFVKAHIFPQTEEQKAKKAAKKAKKEEKKKKKKPTKSRVDVRTIVITAIVDFLVGLALLIIDKLT